MNEKNFCSFYKLNDDEIKKLKENNIRNSAPVQPVSEQIISPAPTAPIKTKSAGKIITVAVSLAVVIFGVIIGINAIPDKNSDNNEIIISEPESVTTEKVKTEKVTTTKKTESKKAKTTVAKTEPVTEKTTEPVNNEAEIEEIKIDMNRHYCTHCDGVLYESDAKKYNLYDANWGIPFSLRNIYIDENEMLIGLFEEDFDLSNVEKEIDTHEDKEDNFYFFDYISTRYTIKDLPNDIEGIPEEVMPDYIVIDYSPEGDIAIGRRYCTRVHFCFDDKPIGYNFEFVKGKDLLEDEIETLKENIKEYGLTE